MTQEPKVWDAGLQPERTALAWHRLGLTTAALALLLPKLTWPVLATWSLLPTGAVLVLAIAVAVLGRRRYTQQNHALHSRHHLPDAKLPLLIMITTTVVALCGGVVLTLRTTQ